MQYSPSSPGQPPSGSGASSMAIHRGRGAALFWFSASASVILLGLGMAVLRHPGGFDWMYTVISHLASTTRNPEGGRWASGGLFGAVILLWPVTRFFARAHPRAIAGVVVLRIGLVCGGILGIEGLLTLEFSRHLRKGHEFLALLTFAAFYGGVLGLYLFRIRENAAFLLPALLVIFPLCAVGIAQVVLYFDQRELGWVGVEWRAMGIPFWLSFAFWQWIAGAFLGIGLGCLILTGHGTRAVRDRCGPNRHGGATGDAARIPSTLNDP